MMAHDIMYWNPLMRLPLTSLVLIDRTQQYTRAVPTIVPRTIGERLTALTKLHGMLIPAGASIGAPLQLFAALRDISCVYEHADELKWMTSHGTVQSLCVFIPSRGSPLEHEVLFGPFCE